MLGNSILAINASISNGHGRVEYHFLDDLPMEHFVINKSSGVITTNLKLTDPIVYQFPVILKNSLDVKRITVISVLVSVIDMNNNAPRFLEPKTLYKEIYIEESIGIGGLVSVVRASDDDVGSNAEISYSLVDGNTNDAFTINNFGQVRVKQTLKAETKNFYSLIVRAEDNGEDRQSSKNDVTLSITVKTRPVAPVVPPVIEITLPVVTTQTAKSLQTI